MPGAAGGRREEEEGRQRRNIGEQSSLTAQLFANSLHILQLHGREGGREDRKGEEEKNKLYTHENKREGSNCELVIQEAGREG